MNLASATSEPFVERIKPIETKPSFPFPKQNRLLRSGDYRRAYKEGMRVSGPYFRAFCHARNDGAESRVGFTCPKALGKAVDRNRIKRRMREAVRHGLAGLAGGWDVVFNPRRKVLDAPLPMLQREVERVFRRCSAF